MNHLTNAPKNHDLYHPCSCAGCIIQKSIFLLCKGKPQPSQSLTVEELESMGAVGIYRADKET